MKAILSIFIFCMVTGCGTTTSKNDDGGTVTVLPVNEVIWEQLNPARGEKSPKAGTLWGGRNTTKPTGFLAQFVDGFSSPPHIHNATYRAVVISGLIHNDDPAAAKMWMPRISFWTQPAGEAHITAARGTFNLALVEIDEGPYLVMPTERAYDNGDRPVNIAASNLVWTEEASGKPFPAGAEVAYLWGSTKNGASNGRFLKLPAGFAGELRTDGSIFHAVVVSGQLLHRSSGVHALEPGSYFGSQYSALHAVASAEEEVIIYINTNGAVELLPDAGSSPAF